MKRLAWLLLNAVVSFVVWMYVHLAFVCESFTDILCGLR